MLIHTVAGKKQLSKAPETLHGNPSIRNIEQSKMAAIHMGQANQSSTSENISRNTRIHFLCPHVEIYKIVRNRSIASCKFSWEFAKEIRT